MKLKTHFLLAFGVSALLCMLPAPVFADILKEGWFAPEGGQVTLNKAKSFYAAKRSVRRESPAAGPLAAESVTAAGPEIQNLARALQHDPKLIYDYVHNHIDYTPYYGSMKGATLTLLEGSGNDFDQASLLVALLRASSYPAQFVIGEQTIPGDDLANWLGGFGNSTLYPRWQKISRMLSWHGIPFEWANTGGDTAIVARAWVKANIGGVDYVFDPAFKAYSYFPEQLDVATFLSSTGHDISNFFTEVMSGATIGTDYVQNLNETNVRNKLAAYTTSVVDTIRSQFPNDDVRHVYGGREIIQTNLTTYQTSLPFATSVDVISDEIGAEYQTTLRIQLEGIDVTFDTGDMAHKRLTVTFTPSDFRPELRLDGTLIAQGNATTQNTFYNATITTDHPFAFNSGMYFDQTSTSPMLSGNNTYAIVKAFGLVSDNFIKKRNDEIIKNLNAGSAETSEEVLGEALNVIGLTWMQEKYGASTLLAPSFDVSHNVLHGIGTVSQTSGYVIAINQGARQVVNIGSLDDSQIRGAFLESTWAIGSAFEHGVLEQLVGPENPHVSTVKILQLANEQGYKIFKADSGNFPIILPQLQNYGSVSGIQSLVDNGYTIILPENGKFSLGGPWWWGGYAYFQSPGLGAGFIINSGLNGGASAIPAQVPPLEIYDSYKKFFPDPSVRKDILSFMSQDPVDMASGTYLFNHVDLALGEGPPLGLAHKRSYNSSNHFADEGLGFGWVHNYDIRLSRGSHPQPALGHRTPEDAAALITAMHIAYEVIFDRPSDELAYATMALIHKWAMDQLLQSSVVVQFGSESAEFIRHPDGSYTSPPGMTSELVDNGDGTLSLLERFGTRLNFDTNGRIQNWRDADGNEITFTYSGDQLSTVQDEFNRMLTFSYTGDKLTSVSDSEGRSVSYGYDSNNDLVSYTDPEGKVWTYGYDALHQMTSLTNPLGITTATNVYDSDGRVQTQTVPRQGGGTAAYNFYFSGFRNIEEDPFGKQMIYHLDEMGRTTKLENGLGFTTIIAFDGQNHEVQTTDPRNNSTFFNYNGDHNVTQITNALSEESLFRYDPQLRLKEIEDDLNHITYFNYDTEHHLIQTIDAVNNQAGFTYYPNGQVEDVVDGRNTAATFFYDVFGHPESTQVALHPPVQFGFDPIGRNRELTDNENAQTLFDYDKRSLPLKITDPLLKEIIYTYDDAGRLLTRKDRNNDITSYSYTPSGKMDTVTYPDLSTVGFIYNLHDQLTDMIDSLGNTHFERDALYRVTAVTDPHGFTVSYDYDEAGNVTKITYPGSKDVVYTYDDLNRLETVTNWLSQTATYTYDEAGRLTGLTHFNGTQTAYGYDDANRLTSIEHKNPATNNTIARCTYTLLDGNGNRTSIEMLAPLMPAINSANIPYTYNPQKNRLLQAGGTSFTYDDEGQLETMGGVSYAFDYEHRLISAGSSLYAYNGIGTRLGATHVGIETRYIYDLAGNLLAEANSNNEIIGYYVHGLGLLAMITPQDQTFSYHYDGTGNTIVITDESKQIHNTYAYTPFGTITEDEVFDQPFTFSGEYGVIQEPNGFYYMRARYYDPIIGRFISEDPIRFAGGDVNLFAYVGNNPINFVDPWGLAVGDWWDLWANYKRAWEIQKYMMKRFGGHNSLGDALRHAEWSRRTTIETNAFTARSAGIAHEVDNLIRNAQPWTEARMDLINNAEGRNAAANNRPVDINNLQTSLQGPDGDYCGKYSYGGYDRSCRNYDSGGGGNGGGK